MNERNITSRPDSGTLLGQLNLSVSRPKPRPLEGPRKSRAALRTGARACSLPLVSVVVAMLLALVSARVGAQNPSSQIPRVADGVGVRVGERSVFHPGAALTVGFDSNLFNESRKAESPRSAAFMMPSIWWAVGNRPLRDGILDSPATRTQRRVDYYFGMVGGWRLYMHGEERVRQAGKLNIGADGRIHIAPGRRFQLDIDDTFRRMGEPRNFESAREYNFNHISNAVTLRTTLRPGGGRLAIVLGFRNEALLFETPELVNGNRLIIGNETELRYRVRDRSAFSARYSYMFNYFVSCCAEPGTGRNEDSHNYRFLLGYAGQLGEKVVLDAFVGYGWGLYKDDFNGPDHKNTIGHVGLGYFPTTRTRLQVQFGREFNDSVFGNYYTDVGGHLYIRHILRSRTAATFGVGAISRRTAGLPIPGQDTEEILGYTAGANFIRKDLLYTLNAALEQPLGKYFVLGAKYSLAVDDTDFVVHYFSTRDDYGEFSRHMLMLTASFRN